MALSKQMILVSASFQKPLFFAAKLEDTLSSPAERGKPIERMHVDVLKRPEGGVPGLQQGHALSSLPSVKLL